MPIIDQQDIIIRYKLLFYPLDILWLANISSAHPFTMSSKETIAVRTHTTRSRPQPTVAAGAAVINHT